MEKQPLYIIKIGGNVLDKAPALAAFVQQFASLQVAKILVHGGGKIATRIGEQLGIEAKYIDGRRITDDATLQLVTMVYGGLVNKQLVAALQQQGCNALGLTGADANVVPAHRRPVQQIDYGWAGDVETDHIPAATLQAFLQAGLVPVLAPLTHDGQGHMLNTNADTIAASLALALAAHYRVHLVYCFEKKGVLYAEDQEDAVIPKIDRQRFEQLKQDGTLHSGILPKIENALLAVEKGVWKVIIGHADDLVENITEQVVGTIIE